MLMIVIVATLMAVLVLVLTRLRVRMWVPMRMRATLMSMRMPRPMMLTEHLLRERIVFGEGLVVTMLVSAAIRARFGLERQRYLLDRRADAHEHIGKHRIVFELQIIGADFHRRMTIAEVIRGARERQRIRSAYVKHSFMRGNDTHETAIVGDEHVAVVQHGAAR